MFFIGKNSKDSVFSGHVTVTCHNPNKPHGPDLQAVLFKKHGHYSSDKLIHNIGMELPKTMPSVYRDVFSIDLDNIDEIDCILLATTNGQIDYSDEPVSIEVRSINAIHTQALRMPAEYDASEEHYIPSATHLIGALVRTNYGWRYSDLDIFRPERLYKFMTHLSSSPMTYNRFHHLIKRSQREESTAYESLIMSQMLTLPWLSPERLADFMNTQYEPALLELHGHSIMADCQIAWDPLLRFKHYQEASVKMINEGAPWWPQAMQRQDIDQKLAYLLTQKSLSPNWVKMVLLLTPEPDILHFCQKPENADAVFSSIKLPSLLPLLSQKVKRQCLSDDLSL